MENGKERDGKRESIDERKWKRRQQREVNDEIKND